MQYAHEDPISREMIERLFIKYRGHMTNKCFNICGIEAVARDCVQETFLILLLHTPFTDFGQMVTYAYVISKHCAIRHIRKRKMADKHKDAVMEILTQRDTPDTGIFKYYPLDNKLSEGLKKLKEETRIAAIGFMYSIPYDKLAKIYGYTAMTMHHRVKEAIKQLKDYLLGNEETVGQNMAAVSQRNEKTDTIYKLKQAGWKTKDVAEYVGLSSANVATRYWQRLKTMKKYPNSFKDLL